MYNSLSTELTDTFLHDCKKAKDEIIEIKKAHDEKGQKIKNQMKRVDVIIQGNGNILNNLEKPCSTEEKAKILEDILTKAKS